MQRLYNNISSYKEILDQYAAEQKDMGRCKQCQYPWHDGICSCDANVKQKNGIEIYLAEKMAELAHEMDLV